MYRVYQYLDRVTLVFIFLTKGLNNMSRSIKKGPFIANDILRKIEKIQKQTTKPVIQTWSRSCDIVPLMIGYTFAVHNGKSHIPVVITDQMVGHKLGEFSKTRYFRTHDKTDRKAKR